VAAALGDSPGSVAHGDAEGVSSMAHDPDERAGSVGIAEGSGDGGGGAPASSVGLTSGAGAAPGAVAAGGNVGIHEVVGAARTLDASWKYAAAGPALGAARTPAPLLR